MPILWRVEGRGCWTVPRWALEGAERGAVGLGGLRGGEKAGVDRCIGMDLKDALSLVDARRGKEGCGGSDGC
jgi:hypothetical protein